MNRSDDRNPMQPLLHKHEYGRGGVMSLMRPAFGGVLTGVLTTSRAVSFAMVFSHSHPDLTAFSGLFLQGLLFVTVFSQVMYTAGHSLSWSIASPSSTSIPISASLVAAVAKSSSSPKAAALGSLVALAVSSLALGTFLMMLRMAGSRLDTLKSSCPKPLVLGLFTSIGWAMMLSGVQLCDESSGWLRVHVACTLVSGLVMRAITRASLGKNPAAFPCMLAAQVLLFWVVAELTPPDDIRKAGWLFKDFEPYSLRKYFSFWGHAFTTDSLSPDSDIGAVLRKSALWTTVLTKLPVSTLDLFLCCVCALEQTYSIVLPGREECGLAAGTCFLAASVGCSPSYFSLSPSRLCLESGGTSSRIAGIGAMLVPALVMLPFGHVAVGWCPRFVVGGLLVHLGLGYMLEGLWDPMHLIAAMSPGEMVVILLIVVMSILYGFAPAVFVGSALLFFLHKTGTITTAKDPSHCNSA